MKSKFFATLIVAGLAAASNSAFAEDGTITFTGNITSQTCTINGNGTSQNNFTVSLPPVNASVLATDGQTAGRTPFSINLTGCTGEGQVYTYFQPGDTTDLQSGNLKVTGGAQNVQVSLLNSDFSKIKTGADAATQNSKPVAITAGGATLSYFAEYVAMGEAKPGAVNSSVLYTLAYL